jgi:hypothetical protein
MFNSRLITYRSRNFWVSAGGTLFDNVYLDIREKGLGKGWRRGLGRGGEKYFEKRG